MIIALCFDCRRLSNEKGMKCEAFPGGIPDEIILAEHDHHRPFPGDRGLTFLAKSGPETATRKTEKA